MLKDSAQKGESLREGREKRGKAADWKGKLDVVLLLPSASVAASNAPQHLKDKFSASPALSEASPSTRQDERKFCVLNQREKGLPSCPLLLPKSPSWEPSFQLYHTTKKQNSRYSHIPLLHLYVLVPSVHLPSFPSDPILQRTLSLSVSCVGEVDGCSESCQRRLRSCCYRRSEKKEREEERGSHSRRR